ncbi:Chromatin modification-related protein YNG2 [Cryptosporidium felis]|nr:Chromatin modification-related protein YNG2 [Cryptosporidium felis]
MSESSTSSDESDWDGSWTCSRDFPDSLGLNQDQSFPYLLPVTWYSPEEQEKKEPSPHSEYCSRDHSEGFLNSVKTVPGNFLENENEETIQDYLDSSTYTGQEINFSDFQVPNCRSQRLQYNTKLCIDYIEDNISRIMWNLEQQFQECVLTKDSKRQRNHGFSIEEVSEIDSVEQKKYKLRTYISILRYIAGMMENCALLELKWAKDELEMTNLLRSNISEAFMRLQKVNTMSESPKIEANKANDPQNSNSLKVRKSKRIQAKVLEEEVNTVQSETARPEPHDFHSIPNESEKFCFCKQPVLDNMIRCESGNQCIYGVWFHFLCLKIIDEPQKTWYCPGCSKSEEFRALWSHIYQREANKKTLESNTNPKNQEEVEIPTTPIIPSTKNEKRKLGSKKERKRTKSIDGYPKKKLNRGSFFESTKEAPPPVESTQKFKTNPNEEVRDF